MVVRMAGDEVDVVKRLLKYGFFPLAEGVHHVLDEPQTTSSTFGSMARIPAATEAAKVP